MFDTLVVKPVFNLLEVIYAFLPGHDLGIAIILFTFVIRLALWPLVRKQLHHAKAMRKLQPELKKLKKAAAGDKQKEARLQMELYKKHEIKPFATIGTLIVQIPIFIGLYQAVIKLINDSNTLQTLSYSWVRDLDWIKQVSADVSKFDSTLLGLVDLTKYGLERGGGLYMPAIILALVASIVQYYQSKLMLRDQQDARKISEIMKEAAAGKQTDQAEIGAAVGRGMMYFLPIITFVFSVNVPAALSLYILTTSAVGYFQQWHTLKQDQKEMQAIADEKPAPEAAVAAETKNPKPKKAKKPTPAKKKRRR